MTGWRLGWVVAPERHVRDLEKLAQNLYISPPTLSQHAALACFTPDTLAILEERRRAFEARRDFLVPALRELGFRHPGACRPAASSSMPTARAFSHDSERSAATCSTARVSRSRPGSTSAAIARRDHVRFAYTIAMAKLAGRRRAARARSWPAERCAANRTASLLAAAGIAGCTRDGDCRLLLAGRVRPDGHPRARKADRRCHQRGRRRRARRGELDARAVASALSRSRELGLPDNRSYTRYATWAARSSSGTCSPRPRLSLTPRQWCFPVAGCVSYRGYFQESEARAEAARLAAAGRRRGT